MCMCSLMRPLGVEGCLFGVSLLHRNAGGLALTEKVIAAHGDLAREPSTSSTTDSKLATLQQFAEGLKVLLLKSEEEEAMEKAEALRVEAAAALAAAGKGGEKAAQKAKAEEIDKEREDVVGRQQEAEEEPGIHLVAIPQEAAVPQQEIELPVEAPREGTAGLAAAQGDNEPAAAAETGEKQALIDPHEEAALGGEKSTGAQAILSPIET